MNFAMDRNGTAPVRIPSPAGRVLLVEDDDRLRRVIERCLVACGFDIDAVSNGLDALERLREHAYDCILTDISMPQMDGVALLRAIRERDLLVPVVMMTGQPSFATALNALRDGALDYLQKPITLDALERIVRRAVKLNRLGALQHLALSLHGETHVLGERAALERCFDRALDKLWMAYQPIVSATDLSLRGFEALIRSDEGAMAHPRAILDAADRLNRLEELGRTARARAVRPMVERSELLFLNVHPQDLLDEDLYDPTTPLAAMARRIVLEVTERAPLDDVRDVRERIGRLRALGYRIAVDDLGAGYAGLASFAALDPEVAKIDMSLVHGIDEHPKQRRIVGSMIELCRDLGVEVVAEGVETLGQYHCLTDLGVDMLQGYLFARPQRHLLETTWSGEAPIQGIVQYAV